MSAPATSDPKVLARQNRLRQEFVRIGGEEGLIERMLTQYGEQVDVYHWVDWAIDFRKRKPVGNLSGLLVERIRRAAREAGHHAPSSPAERRLEAERYAALHVHVMGIIAKQRIGPHQVAAILEDYRRDGYPQLNVAVIDTLRQLPDDWP